MTRFNFLVAQHSDAVMARGTNQPGIKLINLVAGALKCLHAGQVTGGDGQFALATKCA